MPSTASNQRVASSIAEMRASIAAARRDGARVAFVPTMGALLEGHLRLVDEARRRADFVAMSIFVNPLQFGPGEDLARYPRDVPGDLAKAGSRGVDVVFIPDITTMYPDKRTVVVTPLALHDRWEGAARPGHFIGVLTVVAKLFNIVQPDVAVFGRKDVQQAILVRALVRDLDFPLEIVVVSTCREPDGLAMSSRNAFLSRDDRRHAAAIPRALQAIRALHETGERDSARLLAAGTRMLAAEPSVSVDYLALVDPIAMEEVRCADPGTLAIVAARVGSTRLIDNIELGRDAERIAQ